LKSKELDYLSQQHPQLAGQAPGLQLSPQEQEQQVLLCMAAVFAESFPAKLVAANVRRSPDTRTINFFMFMFKKVEVEYVNGYNE
jgi:hypothetical protein